MPKQAVLKVSFKFAIPVDLMDMATIERSHKIISDAVQALLSAGAIKIARKAELGQINIPTASDRSNPQREAAD